MKKVDRFIHEDAVEIYKAVLSGEVKKFPFGYWNFTVSKTDELENAAKITRYLIEEILSWDIEKLKTSFSVAVIKKYKLSGMLVVLFHSRLFDVIENAYPGKVKPWEMHKAPQGFWNIETSRIATRWMIEEKLKWTDEDIKKHLTKETFIANGLFNAMEVETLDVSPYKTIDNAYPGRFKPWELKMCPMGFWNKENSGIAIRWMIEDKLKLSESEIVNLIENDFLKNGIYGAYTTCGESVFTSLNTAYPGKYKRVGNVIYTVDENVRRTLVSKNNSSNVSGVHYDKRLKKWITTMSIDGKVIYHGSYESYDDAVKTRMELEKERLK